MADLKISALPAASVALAGTEVLPIVQSSATKQVTVANLTAGRAVSALSFASTTGANFATTSGNVGIGTATPAVKLEVSSATGSATPTPTEVRISTTTSASDWSTVLPWGRLSFYSADASDAGPKIQGAVDMISQLANGGRSSMVFSSTVATTGTLTERASLDTNGNLLVASGNIVPSTAAKGINFTANTPAAGMTSQLLNWYEEGTFTPVLKDGASGNAATATAIGRYTRMGRAVQVQIELTSINTTGLTPTNTIYITGLPFICVSNYTPADVFGDTVTSTTGQLQGLIYTSQTYMVLYNNTVTGHAAAIVSQLTSGTSGFYIQANYITS